MKKAVNIREAEARDHEFIFALSPYLAEVAELKWHSAETVQQMQDNYIRDMLAETSTPNITLIAEVEQIPLGFVHARTHKDGVSDEVCITVPLLAIAPKSQGLGLGKLLMVAIEDWAKSLDCRLIHLEVFANNTNARCFYDNLGFQPEMLNMVKVID
ncbi:GNAT family N-acetyltransferase [Alteromonas facilis]|uniref:GNAT family N-acetyltransferase n=1 Tax=Alteromonas facilis TaxID=2048004 RepID=UPI000C283C9E|nr:GNAT family N-acetyltransferase [Alteromonas facilis]